nr:Vomp family autotransporter [Bartonella elizabethae]
MGTIIVAFLSNTSPVYAKNFDRTEQLLQVLEKATAVYSQKNNRNVFSDYNLYNPHTGFFDDISLSKSSYLTVLTTAIMSSVSTSSSYVDFLITMLSEKGKTAVNVLDKDSSSTQKKLESSVDDNHGNGIALLNTPSSSEERYPIQVGGRTFVSARGGSNATNLGQGANAAGQESVAIGHKAQATGKFAITMGDQAEATKEDSIAIGHMAHALGKSSTALGSEYNEKNQNDYTTAKGDYSTALGSVSKALEYGTTAVGHRAYATEKDAVSIGFYSRAKTDHAVALGADSIANVAAGVLGYDPLLHKAATDTTFAWKSTYGAVSVGDLASKNTRQIGGVAAGTQDTDAVNIAQLKSLQAYVDKGWKLSVDGKNTKVVGIDGSIDFATGSNNLSITKGEKDNKVTFDLTKNITLESVKAGQNIFDATGLKIANGPQITTAGINAGSKKITNVVDGTDDTDAVNFSQLKKAVSVSRDNLSEWSKNKVRLGVPDSWTKRGSVVIGAHWEEKRGDGAVVFQGPIANSDFAIAIGTTSYVDSGADEAIAIGYFAKVQPNAKGAIALGSSTVTSVKEGISGYDPKTGQTSTLTEPAWKSGYGALGIGVENRNTRKITSTRQIVGVAAGTNDTDAVNVAQLKSLRGLITRQGSWELSVGDKNTAIGAGDKLNLATGSTNFSITSNAEEKKVTFDLAKNIALDSVTAGQNVFDATGLVITNGPKIMTAGIDAGNKKITNLAEGTEATDAVNFGQLQKIEKEVEQQVVASSFVKQEAETKHITIGKDTEGDKIDIANKNKENRTLTGIKAGVLLEDSNEAVIGSQLFETNNKVSTYLGGGASYKDGKWSAPTFKVQTVDDQGNKKDEAYTDVAAAFEGVGTSITNVQNKVTNDITHKFSELNQNITNITQQVTGDALLWSDEAQAFAARHKKKAEEQSKTTEENSKITFLLDGAVSKDSTDAITGKQLYSTSNTLATYLDKGAGYDEKGNWKAPSFKVKTVNGEGKEEDKTYPNVAEALTGVGTSFTNVQNKMTKEITNRIDRAITTVQSENLVQQEKSTNNITIGAKVEGNVINIANRKSENRILTGIKDGMTDADAVNFSQLKGVKQEIKDQVKEVKEQVAASSFVKQDLQTKHITIGKDTEGDKIDVANNKNEKRTLTGIKNGALSKDSNEAVTGSQLFTTNQSVTAVSTNLQTVATNIAKSFGVNAKYQDGKWTDPTFTLKTVNDEGKEENKTYQNVADALSGVGTSFTNIQKQVTEQINHVINKVESENLVQQEKATNNITIGAKNEGDVINIINKNGAARTLSGVKAATKENEAVNKGQLDTSIKEANNEITNKFNDFTKSITNITQQVKGDALLWDKGEKAFVADHGEGSAKTNSKVTHLLDGNIAYGSTDAITGGQIYKIGEDIAKFLGGTASFNNGSFTGPTYALSSVNEKGETKQVEFKDIGKAFASIDTNIQKTNNHLTNKFKELNQNITNITQQVKGDALLWDKDEKAFVADHGEGSAKTNSKITRLLDGNISSDSRDAITGSQLYSMGNALSASLGGGASYEGGSWTAPNFTINKFDIKGNATQEDYKTVSDALSGLSTSFTNIQNKITHEISKIESENLVKQHEKTKLITIGGEKDGNEISIANNASGVRSISGVKAGLLTVESTEAINGSQLYSVINVLSRYFSGDAGYKDGKWLAPGFKVAQFTAAGVLSKKENYTNVASAFEAVNESMTKINNRIHDVEQSTFSSGLNWSETEKAFDARHKGQDSKIKHVADGEISESSKEAVNGRQLWQTNKKVKEVESHVNMIDKQVKDIASVADIAVKYDKGTDGKKTNKVTLVGMSESDPVLIDNVAEGRIESGSKEAVTGGQLHDYTNKQMKLVLSDAKKYTNERFKDIVNNTVDDVIHETKSYTDVKFEALRYEIKEVHKESKQAAAIGLAVSNLSYEDTPGSLSLSIGTGTWRNQSAFAVGAGYMSENGRIRSNISATSSGRHWGIGAGLRVKLN